jgi:MFS family permease
VATDAIDQNSGPVKKKGGFHYAFLIVASGIAITCIPCALVLNCAGIYFKPVANYFGVPTAQFTLYFSILNLAMMVMLPIAGKLMSRVDLRIVLSVSVLLDGLSYLAMSQFTAVWMFYIAAIFLGIGTAPLIYLAIPTLVNNWCKVRVGFFIGLCMAFAGIGGVIFNPIGTAFINSGTDGWRMGYLVFGIIMLVVTLPFTLFVVRSKPSDKGLEPYGAEQAATQGSSTAPEMGVSAGKAMKTAAFFAVAAFCFLITVNQTVYQFLASYVQSFPSQDIALAAGAVASACMAGQAIGKIILGVINDRSAKGGLFFGLGGGIAGILVLWFLPLQVLLLMAGAFLFGFAYACTTVEAPLLTRAVFGSRDYTNIYSRVSMAGTLGSVVAAVFWAWIIELPNGFSLMFALSIVCMILSICLGLFALRQSRKLERTAE